MFYKNRTQSLFFLIIVNIILFSACRKGKNIPDVSNMDVEVNVRHFERDFFSIDTNNVTSGLEALSEKYPDFFPIFIQIIGADDPRYAPQGVDTTWQVC